MHGFQVIRLIVGVAISIRKSLKVVYGDLFILGERFLILTVKTNDTCSFGERLCA